MTDLLTAPARPVVEKVPPPRQPLAAYGLLVAAWTAVFGLTVCVAVAVVGWFAADTGTFGDAVRIGALSWLVSNGGALHLSGVTITLVPLGAVALIGWTLYRGGRWVSHRCDDPSWRDLSEGTLAIASGYCGLGGIVYAVTQTSDVHADLPRTLTSTFLLGLVFGGLGTLRGAGRGADVLVRLPTEARAALYGCCGGAGVLMAASAALATVSIATHFTTAVTLSESLHSGLVGGAVLCVLGLALLPNGVLWAGAFLAGPGFTVGAGSVVAPSHVSTGPLPAFPLLAAVPHTDGSTWWQAGALVVPLAAGAVAGLLAVRRYPVTGFDTAAVRGGLAGLAAGASFGLLTGLSGGAVGPGRMQDLGPYVQATVLACAAACLLGGAVAAVAARWLAIGRPMPTRRRGNPPSEPAEDDRQQSTHPLEQAPAADTR